MPSACASHLPELCSSVCQVLGFDLLKSGIFSVLPWITMAIFANLGGWLADTMVSRGVSVTRVRKIMQTVRCPDLKATAAFDL
jgi:hypothetical protein